MPRKGENIYKRKDGRWEGRYVKGHNGKRSLYGYVYAKSYREVREKLQLAKGTVHLHQNSFSSGICSESESTLRSVYKVWFHTISDRIKDSTRVKYSELYTSYLDPTLGTVQISEISEQRIQQLINELLTSGGKQGRGLSSKTVSDAIRLLKCILKFALQRRYIIDGAALDISLKTRVPRLRILSMQEQQRLIYYIKENPEPSNLGILLSLFSGIRIGELCALTWKYIDLTEETIHICRTMQRLASPGENRKTHIIISAPKSECSDRIIPFPEIVLERINKPTDSSCYFLTNTTRFLEPRTMQYRFANVLSKCEIPHVKFHTLRHTFATRCVEIGFDIKSLSEILGHSNVNITLNRYVHPSFETKKNNITKLSLMFED